MKGVSSAILILVCTALIGLGLCWTARGADDMLRMTSADVSVDGSVREGEYSFVDTSKGITLYLAWNQTSLFSAVVADTTGWIGIGFKSDRMQNAEVLIGYVKGGKAALSEQRGKNHSHSTADIPYLKKYAMVESGNAMVLEAELDAKALIRDGQDSMLFIVAYGGDDTDTSYHKARRGITVKLGR